MMVNFMMISTWAELQEIRNTKDSEALENILRRECDDDISWNAASNRNCPPEVLAEILRKEKDDYVSRHAAQNPNCPSEALGEVLRRGIKGGVKGGVSYFAAMNINCPPKERIEWLEATGRLTKYDPERFELEHDNEDKDLEELKKLL